MANEVTSGVLATALNKVDINEAFTIAYKNRPSLLSLISFGMNERPYEGYKYGWMNGRVDATGSVLTGAIDNAVTVVPVADGAIFRARMVISLAGSDEVMIVVSVSGNDLTVVRGVGGTTAEASVGSDDAVYVDSVGREENSLAENDSIYQPTREENFFQTMDTAIEFSRRALDTMQFGNTNALSFQLDQKMQQLAVQMDKALIRGRKFTQTIAGEESTYVGGLGYWTSQIGAINVDNGAAALTLDAINDLNAEIVTRGGMANTIVVGISAARVINDLVSAKYSSQRLADWTSDEGSVTRLPSDLPLIGNVTQIVIDTNVNDSELYMLDTNMCTVIPMEGANGGEAGTWQTKDATQNGQDGERLRIIGDFTFEIRQHETHMARLYNIA